MAGLNRLLAGAGAVLAVLSIAACGYHLQRPRALAPVMRRTVIVAGNPYSDLARGLTRALNATNVQTVSAPETATAELHILADSASRRVVSVDNRDRPRAYELHYEVRFSLTHGKQKVLAPQTVSLTRTFAFDPENILAGSQEASRLLNAMRADLVQVILRRLAAVSGPGA
jgi:LPS-assembly lipoprotein